MDINTITVHGELVIEKQDDGEHVACVQLEATGESARRLETLVTGDQRTGLTYQETNTMAVVAYQRADHRDAFIVMIGVNPKVGKVG